MIKSWWQKIKDERLASKMEKRKRALVYGLAWCDCGAPMAADMKNRRWDCADIILGTAIERDKPGAMVHSDVMPFAFWKVKKAYPNVYVRREPQRQSS